MNIANNRFFDFKIFQILEQKIPSNYNIHISNSSAILCRIVPIFTKSQHLLQPWNQKCGIDGSTSTAMGFAMMNENPTILISGELGFFYDINGLWNNYIPPYTRIIVMNNGEGNIFRIIPGSTTSNAIDEFIATKHQKTAKI